MGEPFVLSRTLELLADSWPHGQKKTRLPSVWFASDQGLHLWGVHWFRDCQTIGNRCDLVIVDDAIREIGEYTLAKEKFAGGV
jgi:hypothetical protein